MSFYVRSRDAYFYFFLFTTTCRGLEAGILASMMNSIQQELTLSYTMEGVLAAAPDIGIVPAGLIAIWVFRHVSAYATCALSCLIIGCTALLAVFVTTWKDLYFLEACLMLVCGLLSLLFHPDLVKVGVMVSARKGQGTAAMTSDMQEQKERRSKPPPRRTNKSK